MGSEKPNVLVLGGCGFIGRYIISELIEKDMAELVQVIDKVPPQIAWMNAYHKKIFKDSKVVFKSANLIHPGSCEAAFAEAEFDWVINAAGETKSAQDEAVYKEGICQISSNCAKLAAKHSVKMYIEISSSQLASTDKVPLREDSSISPWTTTAKYKAESEKIIRGIPGLNWIIVRPAIIYGCSDRTGLTPRLVVGALYRSLDEKMKLLWDGDLRMNTAHVNDVARAVVWLCERGRTEQIYNVVDSGDTTQGLLTKIISEIFNIRYDFWGNALSTIGKLDMDHLVYQVNEKHMGPWAKLCTSGGVENTPLTPYLDRDALHNRGLRLDGSKLRREGFVYSFPEVTKENLIKILEDFIAMKLFPRNALPERGP